MWKSKFTKSSGYGERNGVRGRNHRAKEQDNTAAVHAKERRRSKKTQFRFLVVNPFSNFFVKKANRRRLDNWRAEERSRVDDGGQGQGSPPAARPLQTEAFRSDTRPAGDLGRPDRCDPYEAVGWKDPELDEMGRKERRKGTRRIGTDLAVDGGSAAGGGVVDGGVCVCGGSGRRTTEEEEEAAEKSADHLEVDACRDILSATESWDQHYQTYRCQVATDLSKRSRSIGDDLLRLRRGRREVFKQLQQFGYIDVNAVVDDVFIVRGFDRLCRDVCEWRRQAINALRQRHKQLDDDDDDDDDEDDEDATTTTEEEDASEEEDDIVRHLVTTRRHIDNYKTRIAQQLSAKDDEIERLTEQLSAAQSLSFTVKMNNRPPVQPQSVFTDHKATSRVFRGCLSSDVTYWAQRTAIFPDKIRETMCENVATKAGDTAENRKPPRVGTPPNQLKEPGSVKTESEKKTGSRRFDLKDIRW